MESTLWDVVPLFVIDDALDICAEGPHTDHASEVQA